MLAGATAEERAAYSLRADAQAYGYTKGEAKAIAVAGLDDAAEWAGTKARLATLAAEVEQERTLQRPPLNLGPCLPP